MAELAALGVKATVDGVEKATDQLDRLAGAAGKAENATDKLAPSAKNAGDGVKGLGGEARTAEGALAKMAGSLGSVIGKFAAMAGAALSVGALFALARKGANDIDDAAKAARRLGASILGFRALELAAGEAGVSVSSLADAVQTMDREIARGSTNAVSALSKIGLTVKDIVGLDADQKIALIGDKIKEFGLSSGQASAMLQDFGIRNKEFLLAVTDGGNALRAARADIDDYGLAISQVDSDRIETANDAIGRLALAGQYLSQQLALALMPALGDLAKVITDSLREGGLLRAVLDGIALVMKGLVGSVNLVIGAFSTLRTVMDLPERSIRWLLGLGPTSLQAQRAVDQLTLAMADQIAQVNSLTGAMGPGVTMSKNMAQAKLDEAKATYAAADAMRQQQVDMIKATTAWSEAQATIDQAQRNMARVVDEQNSFSYDRGAIDDMRSQLQAAVDAQQALIGEASALSPAYIAAQENIAMIEAAINAATGETVTFTGNLITAEDITNRLAGSAGAIDFSAAVSGSNELTQSFLDRTALAEAELRYGKESAQYLSQQLNQERQIQFAKIAALDITNQQKAAARQAYDQMVITEAKTHGWTVTLGDANGRLSAAYQYLVKISATQPGSGWLSTAIARAATLATTLWDAVAANNSLSVAGPVASDERGSQRGIVHDATRYTRDNPLAVSVGGVGDGGGGGGTDGALSGLISELSTERETLDAWYQDKMKLIQSYSDQELEIVGGRHGALERLEAEHQDRLRALGSDTNNQRLEDIAGFFGGMADLAKSGGERTLKIAQGLAAVQGIVNSYLAFTEVLKDPAYVGRPWARFGAAASALASGLAAVRSIKGASSGGGGGSVPIGGGSSGGAQQSAPEAPLRVTLDTIDPGSIYSGSAMIKMFEAIQKEAGNRGIVWVPAGA
jgi:hypothetical protein